MSRHKEVSNLMRRSLFLTFFCIVSVVFTSLYAQRRPAIDERVLATIKQTTAFMLDEVGYNGAFVWAYLPDLSRQWGEMEAFRTMGWTQWEGSPEVGEFFLDLYNATGDEYYYQAAEVVAGALIWGQHPSGGWNYHFDLAGEASHRHWYNTIGKSGRRLEEFNHYYGNATYDDDATASPARFILRMYKQKLDPKYRASVEKTVKFLLDSQYAIGGWPQRFPLMYSYSPGGIPDYTSYITLNDGVLENNVDLLIMYYRALGDKSLIDPILRAMNCAIMLQQGTPHPGWGDQYSLDYKPNHARRFEPPHINSRMTYHMCESLMNFYKLTGETKFLARIPEAIDWLESIKVSDDFARQYGGRRYAPGLDACPMFVEIGTNRAMRSTVADGRYVISYDPPYSLAVFDIGDLRKRYNELIALPVEAATADSELLTTEPFKFPDYVALRWPELTAASHIYRNPTGDVIKEEKPTLQEVNELMSQLVDGKYWLVPLREISHPYRGPLHESPTPNAGAPTNLYDTSPFRPDPPVMGITTDSYMTNVTRLVRFLLDK